MRKAPSSSPSLSTFSLVFSLLRSAASRAYAVGRRRGRLIVPRREREREGGVSEIYIWRGLV